MKNCFTKLLGEVTSFEDSKHQLLRAICFSGPCNPAPAGHDDYPGLTQPCTSEAQPEVVHVRTATGERLSTLVQRPAVEHLDMLQTDGSLRNTPVGSTRALFVSLGNTMWP